MYHLLQIFRTLFHKNRSFYKKLRKILRFSPHHIRFYEIAFIHKSASLRLNDGTLINNERLEYLGDAVLDAVIAEYLYRSFPDKDEGFLTQMRAKIVKRKQLNKLARDLGIQELIIAHLEGNCNSKHVYGDTLEALIGSIYLDQGFKKVRRFILRQILQYLDLDHLAKLEIDFKSRLIEWAQKFRFDIIYDSHEEDEENTHTPPVFVSRVRLFDEILGSGRGNSKKESEQKASEAALKMVMQHTIATGTTK